MTAVAEAVRRSDTQRLTFDLSAAFEATEPAEARGITRDAVRMMVAYKSEQHRAMPTGFPSRHVSVMHTDSDLS